MPVNSNMFLLIDGKIFKIGKSGNKLMEMYTFAQHKGGNGLNWQSCLIANGVIIGLFGPDGGRRQDSHMLRECGIDVQLEEAAAAAAALFPEMGPSADSWCGGGDLGYPLLINPQT